MRGSPGYSIRGETVRLTSRSHRAALAIVTGVLAVVVMGVRAQEPRRYPPLAEFAQELAVQKPVPMLARTNWSESSRRFRRLDDAVAIDRFT